MIITKSFENFLNKDLIIDKIANVTMCSEVCSKCGWKNYLVAPTYTCPICGKDLTILKLSRIDGERDETRN